jgi:hypothetical protein
VCRKNRKENKKDQKKEGQKKKRTWTQKTHIKKINRTRSGLIGDLFKDYKEPPHSLRYYLYRRYYLEKDPFME